MTFASDLTTLREALGPFCTRRHDTLGEWSHENCRWCRAIAALARLEAGTWLSEHAAVNAFQAWQRAEYDHGHGSANPDQDACEDAEEQAWNALALLDRGDSDQ